MQKVEVKMKQKTQKKNDGETAAIQKKLTPLLKKLNDKYGRHALPEGESLLDYLIYYLLMYNCPITSAKKAFRAFTNGEDFVDWNEVRVTPERELRRLLDSFKCDPGLAKKIQDILTDVFAKFHDMSLESLKKESQEKCRKRLMALDGADKPLITWLLRLSHDYKQVPLDDRAYSILIRTGVFEPSTSRTKMEKVLKDLIDVDDYLTFQHVMAEHGKKTCTEDGTMKCKRCLVEQNCDYFQLTKGRHPKDRTSFEIMESGLVDLEPPKKKSRETSSSPSAKVPAETQETARTRKAPTAKIIKNEGLNQKKIKRDKKTTDEKGAAKAKSTNIKASKTSEKAGKKPKNTGNGTTKPKTTKTKTTEKPAPKAKGTTTTKTAKKPIPKGKATPSKAKPSKTAKIAKTTKTAKTVKKPIPKEKATPSKAKGGVKKK